MKALVLLIVLVGCISAAWARPDLNAFINKKVTSTHELVQHVKTDKAVMDRYCRHYAMTPQEVISYLKTLKVGYLKKNSPFVIYSVPKGGYLKSHFEVLKKGTPIFVDAAGVPILVLKCGNPLTRGPKNFELLNEPVLELGPESTEAELDAELVPEDVLALMTPEFREFEIIPENEEIADLAEMRTKNIPIIGGGSLPFGLMGIPLAFDHPHDTPNVPGPAAIVPFAFGALLNGLRKRRAKRS